MRQQRRAAGLVERGEPVPKRGVVGRQIGLPDLLSPRDRVGGHAVFQVGCLNRHVDMAHRRLQTGARRPVLEHIEAELV